MSITVLAWGLVLLSVVVLILAVMVFGLARQIGILHERVAPMGAMVSDHGPAVGEPAPDLQVTTLNGDEVRTGGPHAEARLRLILFVSPSCPVCKKLLPIVRSFAAGEKLVVLLVGDGEAAEQARMRSEFRLEHVPYVNSPRVGMAFHVGKLPYAVLIDGDGVIRAKGLVNSREHLESLIIARESGYGTIQAYLEARSRIDGIGYNGRVPGT